MVNQRIVGSTVLSLVLALGLSACGKKKEEPAAPAQADATTEQQAAASANGSKSENDLYIERLNKDVKVENPDALLDEVNKDTQQ
jgi:uncharacterized lipoprotein YbaY